MPRPRKAPRLREKSGYLVTDVYRPDGTRTTVNFGPVPAASVDAAGVYELFARWLKLFESNPHKCLSFDSPHDAVTKMSLASDIETVGDLIDSYLTYAESAFKLTRRGQINPHYQRLCKVIEFMVSYRPWPVNKFGPDDLRDVRQAMLDYRYARGKEEPNRQMTRTSINEHIKQLKNMFTWGVGRRAVEPATEQALRGEVRSLRYGHPGAIEKKRRHKVTDEEFRKVVELVNPVIAAMLQVLRNSICRPEEVLVIRRRDVLRADSACWLYVPHSDMTPLGSHKTLGAGDGEGQVRVIPFTATTQKILLPFMDAAATDDTYIFSPKAAVDQYLEEKFTNRKTPLSCGNRPGTNRREHPMIEPGDHYQRNSFYSAVQRACKRSGVKAFSLYDVRRASITDIDAALGRDEAYRLTGHADPDTTDIYNLEIVKRMIEKAKEYETAQATQT